MVYTVIDLVDDDDDDHTIPPPPPTPPLPPHPFGLGGAHKRSAPPPHPRSRLRTPLLGPPFSTNRRNSRFSDETEVIDLVSSDDDDDDYHDDGADDDDDDEDSGVDEESSDYSFLHGNNHSSKEKSEGRSLFSSSTPSSSRSGGPVARNHNQLITPAPTPAPAARPSTTSSSNAKLSSSGPPPRKKRKLVVKEEFPPKEFGEANIGDEVVEIAGEDDTENAAFGELFSPSSSLKEPQIGSDSSKKKVVDDDDDMEIEVVGGNIMAASDMPHQREGCTRYPFQVNTRGIAAMTKNNMQYCSNCYCYVCDAKVTDCDDWEEHCNATYRISQWKELRKKKNDPIMKLMSSTQRKRYETMFARWMIDEVSDDDDDDDGDDYGYNYHYYMGRDSFSFSNFLPFAMKYFEDPFSDENDFIAVAALFVCAIESKASSYYYLSMIKEAVMICIAHANCSVAMAESLIAACSKMFPDANTSISTLYAFLKNPDKVYVEQSSIISSVGFKLAFYLLQRVAIKMDLKLMEEWLSLTCPKVKDSYLIIAIIIRLTNLPKVDEVKTLADTVARCCKLIDPKCFLQDANYTRVFLQPEGILRFMGMMLDLCKSDQIISQCPIIHQFSYMLLHICVKEKQIDLNELWTNLTKEGSIIRENRVNFGVLEWVNRELSVVDSIPPIPPLESSSSSSSFSPSSIPLSTSSSSAQAPQAAASIASSSIALPSRDKTKSVELALVLYWLYAINRLNENGLEAMIESVEQLMAGIGAMGAMLVSNFLVKTAEFNQTLDLIPLCCKLAAKAVVSPDFTNLESSLSPILLKELQRIPTIEHLPRSAGDGMMFEITGMRTFHIYSHCEYVAVEKSVFVQDHPGHTDAMRALVLPDSILLKQQSRIAVGAYLSINEMAIVVKQFLEEFNLISVEKVNLLTRWSTRLIIVWKGMVINLWRAQFDDKTALDLATSFASLKSQHTIQSLCKIASESRSALGTFGTLMCFIAHALAVCCTDAMQSYVTGPLMPTLASFKKTLCNLFLTCSHEEISSAYLIAEKEQALSIVRSIWMRVAFVALNNQKRIDRLELKFVYALWAEDWLMARNLVHTASSISVFSSLAGTKLDEFVWEDNKKASNIQNLVMIFEESIKKIAPYNTSMAIANCANPLFTCGSRDSALFHLYTHLTPSFVTTYCSWKSPFLCRQATVLLHNNSNNQDRLALEDTLANVVRACQEVASTNEITSFAQSCAFIGEFQLVLTLCDGDMLRVKKALVGNDDVSNFMITMANMLVLCPEHTIESFVRALNPSFSNRPALYEPHLEIVTDVLRKNISEAENSGLPILETRCRREMLFYCRPCKDTVEGLIKSAENDPQLIPSLIDWVNASKIVPSYVKLELMRSMMPEEALNEWIFFFHPQSSSEGDLSMAVDVILRFLPTLSNPDSVLCFFTRCLLNCPNLMSHGDFLPKIDPKWLIPNSSSLQEGRVEEENFMKAILQMIINKDTVRDNIDALRKYTNLYRQYRARIIALFCAGDDFNRSIDFHIHFHEYKGLFASIRSIVFVSEDEFPRIDLSYERGVKCLDKLSARITAEVLASHGNDETTSRSNTEGFLQALTYPDSFLRSLFGFIVRLVGCLYGSGHLMVEVYEGAIKKIMRKVDKLSKNNVFIRNYLQSALTLLKDFSSSFFYALPPHTQDHFSRCASDELDLASANLRAGASGSSSTQPADGHSSSSNSSSVSDPGNAPVQGMSLLMEMVTKTTVAINYTARLDLLETVLTMYLRGSLGCMETGRVVSPELMQRLLQKLFFEPTFSLSSNSFMVVSSFPRGIASERGSTVNKLRDIVRELKKPVAELLETIYISIMVGKPFTDSELDQVLGVDDDAFRDKVQSFWADRMFLDSSWQRLGLDLASMAPSLHYLSYLSPSENYADVALRVFDFSVKSKKCSPLLRNLLVLQTLKCLDQTRRRDIIDTGAFFTLLVRAYNEPGSFFLIPELANKIVDRLGAGWIYVPELWGALPFREIAASARLLQHVTVEAMKKARPFQSILSPLTLLWRGLLRDADVLYQENAIRHVMESIIGLALNLSSCTVSAAIRNTLEGFLVDIKKLLLPFRPMYQAIINEALDKAIRLVKSKPKVVALFRNILQA